MMFDPMTASSPSMSSVIPQRKGLLWQQRDKLFSRWKERYFILTKEYFHCFKKGSSRMTEMGGFIFKLKLMEVDHVELLDKRGYLTICISLLKDGKIYLRRPEGIKDWFTLLQVFKLNLFFWRAFLESEWRMSQLYRSWLPKAGV